MSILLHLRTSWALKEQQPFKNCSCVFLHCVHFLKGLEFYKMYFAQRFAPFQGLVYIDKKDRKHYVVPVFLLQKQLVKTAKPAIILYTDLINSYIQRRRTMTAHIQNTENTAEPLECIPVIQAKISSQADNSVSQCQRPESSYQRFLIKFGLCHCKSLLLLQCLFSPRDFTVFNCFDFKIHRDYKEIQY